MMGEKIKELIKRGYEIDIAPIGSVSGDFTITIRYKDFKIKWIHSMKTIDHMNWAFDEYLEDFIERMVKELEMNIKNGQKILLAETQERFLQEA